MAYNAAPSSFNKYTTNDASLSDLCIFCPKFIIHSRTLVQGQPSPYTALNVFRFEFYASCVSVSKLCQLALSQLGEILHPRYLKILILLYYILLYDCLSYYKASESHCFLFLGRNLQPILFVRRCYSTQILLLLLTLFWVDDKQLLVIKNLNVVAILYSSRWRTSVN